MTANFQNPLTNTFRRSRQNISNLRRPIVEVQRDGGRMHAIRDSEKAHGPDVPGMDDQILTATANGGNHGSIVQFQGKAQGSQGDEGAQGGQTQIGQRQEG